MSKSLITGSLESQVSADGAMCVTDKSAALFGKRTFRMFHEFAAATVVKFVIATNFYLTSQRLWTGQGAARLVITTGGTEGGTFSPVATKFCLNTVGGDSAGATTITAGGTLTGGTTREVLRSDSATAGGGSGNSDTVASRRYLAAGTYYFVIGVTGTTAGMYSLEWEEA